MATCFSTSRVTYNSSPPLKTGVGMAAKGEACDVLLTSIETQKHSQNFVMLGTFDEAV